MKLTTKAVLSLSIGIVTGVGIALGFIDGKKKADKTMKQFEDWVKRNDDMSKNLDVLEKELKDFKKENEVTADLIKELQEGQKEKLHIKRINEAIKKKDFQTMYSEFEDRYNKYPIQMSRCESFRNAVKEGLITEELANEAREYYGKLWNYVGD